LSRMGSKALKLIAEMVHISKRGKVRWKHFFSS